MSIYLIDFIDTATSEEINQYLSSIEATILKTFSAFNNVYYIESLLTPPPSDIVESCIDDNSNPIQLLNTTIISDQNFGKIVLDGSVPAITVTNEDKNWWKFYSLIEPNLEASEYVTNRRGSGNIIYLLDSGIDTGHPEFEGADVQNLFSFNNNFDDKNGHGTALASVMVGKTCGMSNATVKSVKIFDPNTVTKQSDILTALDTVYQDTLATQADHYIVNISWAIPKNTYVEDKIRRLMNYGIFFVVAAGNSGTSIGDVTPASMLEVITVGSYNNQLLPSDFSNYTGGSSISYTANSTNSGELDGWAPGEMIWAAGLEGTYGFTAGTSVAAAIQSAALAYNFSIGYVPPIDYVDVTTHLYHRQTGLGRRNLLDLSDPKYSSSNNQVTTFFDVRNEYSDTYDIAVRYRIVENGKITIQLFNPWAIKQLEVLSDFPNETFVINSNGKMYGIAPAINGSDFKYKIITLPFRITNNDDTVEDVNFTLLVLGDTFDPEIDPIADSDVDIVLQVGDVFCSQFSCYESSCLNNCGMVGCGSYQPDLGQCLKNESYCECFF